MTKYILNANGEPEPCYDVLAWGRWFEANDEARRVGNDEAGGVRVSTVFLGLDHQFTQGPPLLYETTIFGGEHDGYQDRYSTREEAEFGHAKALKLVEATPKEPQP